MKLDLDTLFKLFEEIEPTLKERGPGVPGGLKLYDQEVLDLVVPEVIFRETDIAGNKEAVDEIKKYLTGDTVVKRLEQLVELSLSNKGMTKQSSNEFRQLINKLAIIDGILSIFKSFEATTAGTVAEQVISALFANAQRLNTQETTDEGYVTDVIIGDKHYAVKTVSEGSSRTMSAGNFAKTLVEKGSITLLDCTKVLDGKQVVGLSVFEKEIKLEGGYDGFLQLKRDLDKDPILSKKTDRGIETVQDLVDAWQNPQDYVVASNEKRFELADLRSTRETKIQGFTSYRVAYQQTQGKLIELKETSEDIKKQITLITIKVRKNIITLKDALQEIASGMSKFFVSKGTEKTQVRLSMENAASKVEPQTKEITTKMEE